MTIGFNQSQFSFDEGIGIASVTVVISGDIARPVQLRVTGGE